MVFGWLRKKKGAGDVTAAAEPGQSSSAANLDASMQDALLKEPNVQAALQNAGERALSDPEVQKELLRSCSHKFPQCAANAQAEVERMASDPQVQARAKEYVGQLMAAVGGAGDRFVGLIEQGPTGVRILAFAGGAASCTVAVLAMINVLDLVAHPVTYVISSYLFIFSLTTMLFEAPPEWIAQAPGCGQYQAYLMEKAEFLTESLGRGMFYCFQGSLWMALGSLLSLQNLAVGVYLLFIGALHILMHFGVMPHEVAQRMRTGYDAHLAPRFSAVNTDPH